MTCAVALTLPAGPAYVDAIQRVWAAGDAIAPIDHRLPAGEVARVLKAIAPKSAASPS